MPNPTISFEQATMAYLAGIKSTGVVPDQPNRFMSTLVTSCCPTWHLRNIHGLLARVDAVSGRVHPIRRG
jgi:hypothetical protein